MCVGRVFFMTLLFYHSFSEQSTWDVPAAAVIHPHKRLIRLRSLRFVLLQLLCCYFTSLTLWPSTYSLLLYSLTPSSRLRCSLFTSTSSTSCLHFDVVSMSQTFFTTSLLDILHTHDHEGLIHALALLANTNIVIESLCLFRYSHFIRTHCHTFLCSSSLVDVYLLPHLAVLPTTLFSATTPLHKSLDHWLTHKLNKANA